MSKRVIIGYKHIVKNEQYISDLYFTYQTDIIDVIGIKIGQGYYWNSVLWNKKPRRYII